ncbi:MAG: hypothetical protein LBL18_01665 [Bacteroidales bacterium]|nr:hypothetical protein [Bacteroidales bacterium]
MKRKVKKSNCTLLLLVCLGIAICTASCVKQHDCDYGETGSFTSYKEPQKIIVCGLGTDINALFHADNGRIYPIVGNIPKAYQDQTDIRVRASVKKFGRERICVAYGVPAVYKLKCIERE